jgi:hypothetical protein
MSKLAVFQAREVRFKEMLMSSPENGSDTWFS